MRLSLKKKKCLVVGETAQSVKVLATKTDDSGSMPRTLHGRDVIIYLHACAVKCVHTHTQDR